MIRKWTKIRASRLESENGNEQCRISTLVCLHILVDVISTPDRIEAMFLDSSLNSRCNECQSTDIDQTYKKVFQCLVCNKCKNEKTEKYSLLTKTECKEVSSVEDASTQNADILSVRITY